MYHYDYATPEEIKPARAELEQIISHVREDVRQYFTFRHEYIGSSSNKRNLVTYDPKTNVGFDFDVNLYVNDKYEDYSAAEIREIFRQSFNKFRFRYGYSPCENSTSVLTIKFIDRRQSRIKHSCDFAIVFDGSKGQQYIRFNKEQQTFSWEYRSKGFEGLEKKADWLKKHGLWNEVRDLYLYLKNTNTNPDRHSRSIYAETINDLYNHHCIQKK